MSTINFLHLLVLNLTIFSPKKRKFGWKFVKNRLKLLKNRFFYLWITVAPIWRTFDAFKLTFWAMQSKISFFSSFYRQNVIFELWITVAPIVCKHREANVSDITTICRKFENWVKIARKKNRSFSLKIWFFGENFTVLLIYWIKPGIWNERQRHASLHSKSLVWNESKTRLRHARQKPDKHSINFSQ